jgi:alkylation response protein AidB-like acyl-CoA dehydrogenase
MESEAGYDELVWRRLSEQLELMSLIVPESAGGMGFGWRELSVVLEEMGRCVYPGPYLSTVFASIALLTMASASARDQLLPGIGAGAIRATFASPLASEPGGSWDGLRAAPLAAADRWQLSGTLNVALDVKGADELLVVGSAAGRPALFLVEPESPGVLIEPLVSMDLTRRLGKVQLSGATVTDISMPGPGPEKIDQAFALMSIALAAEQIGGADQALRATLDYVRTRVQFGRTIGSFQALKHRCADLKVLLESARAVQASALCAADSMAGDLILQGHLTAAMCSDTYLTIARAMVQMHGGIGFTWEHGAHLHLKRAKTSQLIMGSPALHRRLLGELLGLSRR